MDPSYSAGMLFLAALLILLNSFFVLSEFCIVKVRKSRLEELLLEKKPGAQLALYIRENLDTYLSATQLGITLASLALGWIGQPAVAMLLTKLFGHFLTNAAFLQTLSFTAAFVLITLLHVVIGELVPKSIAICAAERSIFFVAKPLHFFHILFSPFIKTFDFLSSTTLRLLKVKQNQPDMHSEEEIKLIASESQKGGIIDEYEGEIIRNAVDFSDTVAKEIMTPRQDMICLDEEKTFEENLATVLETKHTRFPFIKSSKDNILGMIHLRDFISAYASEKKDLKSCAKKIIIVPENLSISKILVQMDRDKIQAALVIDEYGGTAGLITMEDIIEEIVGGVSDYNNIDNEDYKKISDNVYEVNGRLDIESVEKLLGIEFPKDLEELTIGGYVFNRLGHLPVEKERAEDENCHYEIKKMDERSIARLKIVKKQEANYEV